MLFTKSNSTLASTFASIRYMSPLTYLYLCSYSSGSKHSGVRLWKLDRAPLTLIQWKYRLRAAAEWTRRILFACSCIHLRWTGIFKRLIFLAFGSWPIEECMQCIWEERFHEKCISSDTKAILSRKGAYLWGEGLPGDIGASWLQ